VLVYRSVAGAWSTDRPQVVRLSIQTLAAKLQGRLQALTYAGSGGENGTADMTGRTRPLVFGHCLNVTAQIVDPANLIYQLHSGAIEAISAVYDQGVEVPFDDSGGPHDYPTYAELEAAVVPIGFYSSCIAQGYFKLGSVPLGAVTADVKGDKTGDQGSQLTIHMRFLTSQPANLAASIVNARAALALAGVTLFIKSQEALNAPAYLDIDIDTTQDTELYQLGLGGVTPGEPVVYYVETIEQGGNPFKGWSLIPGERCIVAEGASDYILAHELMHTFGLTHSTDTDNLLYPVTGDFTNLPPDLTPTQIATIQSSSLVTLAGTYVDTHSSIIRRMVRVYSPLTAGDIDEASFTTFAEAQPAEIGIFFPAGDETTVEEAIDRVAFSGGAFAGQDRSGLYRVQRLAVPAATPHWVLDDREIISIDRIRPPYRVPWRAWGVGYQKNWTIQKGGDLATGVTQERRVFLEEEYRKVFASSAPIALAHSTSSGAPTRPSLFIDQDDAEAEAVRLIGFYSLGRALYRVSAKTLLFSVEIGQTVRLIYPGWDLRQGRNCVVIAVGDDADTRLTEIEVFG
jgi:hypothetical protein